jgi:transposase
LRNQIFFSLDEANRAIIPALETLNGKEMRRIGVSRRHLLETIERRALKPLPDEDYEYAEWRLVRVNIDYHVEYKEYFYSVPHTLIGQQLDLRATERGIEIFHHGQRVAVHQRRYGGVKRHGSKTEHMPSSHRHYAEWTPERFQRWGRNIGPQTEGLITAILARRAHPEQGFRSCMGVLRLYRSLDPAYAELVSAHAVEIGAFSYKDIASIIANRMANAAPAAANDDAVIDHGNLRGPGYFF